MTVVTLLAIGLLTGVTTVLFGFGGLEITADGLVQRPSVLPPQWKNLRIKINGKIYQATNQ